MRDKILEELGITEEELKNLPPEEQERLERKIVEKLQTPRELQTAQDEQGTLHEPA